MSVYLFTLVLEIVFIFMKESENSQGLIILIISFYTPLMLMTLFFFLVTEIQIFEHFSIFSGLKPNKSRYEIADIGVLKEVQMTLCCVECVNLKTNAIKTQGIHFSYNRSLENMRTIGDIS